MVSTNNSLRFLIVFTIITTCWCNTSTLFASAPDTTGIPANSQAVDSRPALALKSEQDRAAMLHYKALDKFKKGNYKDAIKLLKKVLNLHHDNAYVHDLAAVYDEMGLPKKAYNAYRKLRPMDGTSKWNRVRIEARRADFALERGLGREAFAAYGQAIHRYELHGLDSANVYAALLNNRAVTRFFYQSHTSVDTTLNIHTRDIVQARELLWEANMLAPEDCVVEHNLHFVDALLAGISWDSISSKPAYFRPRHIAQLDLPEVTCAPPKPKVHQAIVEYLDREKEVVFVLDVSGSMLAPTPQGKSRFELMREIVYGLLDDLHSDVEIGLITLGSSCDQEATVSVATRDGLSRDSLKSIVAGLRIDGATPLNQRLLQSADLFRGHRGKDRAVFLCSDGLNSCAFGGNEDVSTCEIAAELGSRGIKLHAFSLLLEDAASSFETYAVYDCMIKATEGELLGLTEEGHEVKTARLDDPIVSKPLSKHDLLGGKYRGTELKPKPEGDDTSTAMATY